MSPPTSQMISRMAHARISHLSLPLSLCVSNRYSFAWKIGISITSHEHPQKHMFITIRAKRGIMANSRLEDPPVLYFMTNGFIVLSATSAPFFSLSIAVPFVVVPSAKIQSDVYYPVSSINFYLSPICSTSFYLASIDENRSMKMQSTTFAKVEKNGTCLNSAFIVKAKSQCLVVIIGSSQLTWLPIYVGTFLIGLYPFL